MEEFLKEIIEFLKKQGFRISPKKHWIYMKEEICKDGLHMQYIDLTQMSSYAYSKGCAVPSSKMTNRDMATIKLMLDKSQIKLF